MQFPLYGLYAVPAVRAVCSSRCTGCMQFPLYGLYAVHAVRAVCSSRCTGCMLFPLYGLYAVPAVRAVRSSRCTGCKQFPLYGLYAVPAVQFHSPRFYPLYVGFSTRAALFLLTFVSLVSPSVTPWSIILRLAPPFQLSLCLSFLRVASVSHSRILRDVLFRDIPFTCQNHRHPA
jgi:hypothetical protein